MLPRMMQTFYLPLRNGRLFIRQWGEGLPLLIVLPGYGYEGGVVEPMLPALQRRFTVCAVDFPFHGQSEWQPNYFTQEDMTELIQTLSSKLGYKRFSLLGHSLGGRVATCLAGQLAPQLEHLILLAPAGIGRHQLIYPRFVQNLVEKTLQYPAWLRALLKAGNRLGLVSNFHRRYAEVHLYPPAARYRLFRTWNSLPEFQPERAEVRRVIQNLPVPILLIVGKKDRVIPNGPLKAYYEENTRTQILELNAGHELFIPAAATAIIQSL